MEIMKNQVEQLEKLLLKLESIKVLPEGSEESKLWRAEVDNLFRSMYGQYSPQYDEIHQLLFLMPLATPSGDMSSFIKYEERLCKIESIIKKNYFLTQSLLIHKNAQRRICTDTTAV